jgi:hypothetical protein
MTTLFTFNVTTVMIAIILRVPRHPIEQIAPIQISLNQIFAVYLLFVNQVFFMWTVRFFGVIF